MAKKAKAKKASPKGNAMKQAEDVLMLIANEFTQAQDEFIRFKEKGIKACSGRIRKHLMNIKRACGDGRKAIQDARAALK